VTRVLVCAGDASGDAHAADLVRALAARLPEARFVGLGGEALEAAGVEIRVPLRDVAVGRCPRPDAGASRHAQGRASGLGRTGEWSAAGRTLR